MRKQMVEVMARKTVSYECQRYEIDQPFLMAPEHVSNHVELGLIHGTDGAPEEKETGEEPVAPLDGELESLEASWPLTMGVEKYLEKYPSGPQSALARKIYEGRLSALDSKAE
jgi:hypothetical protein